MSLPPEKPTDHKRVIAFLARESSASIDEVTRLYEQERTQLEAGARIKHFLPILAIRNVRAALRLSRVEAVTPPLEDTTRISGEWRPTGWKERMSWVLGGRHRHVPPTYGLEPNRP